MTNLITTEATEVRATEATEVKATEATEQTLSENGTRNVNVRIDKSVAKDILQPLKREFKAKNISQVIERLYLEYKYRSKKNS